MKKLIVIIIVLIVLCGIYMFKNSHKTSNVKMVDISLNVSVEELLSKNKPVILDFGGSWCKPCQIFHPILESMNNKYSKDIIIKYADVDKFGSLAKDMGVNVIPAQFIWTKEGKPYKPNNNINFKYIKDKTGNVKYTIHEGMLSEEEMEIIIKELL